VQTDLLDVVHATMMNTELPEYFRDQRSICICPAIQAERARWKRESEPVFIPKTEQWAWICAGPPMQEFMTSKERQEAKVQFRNGRKSFE
jgi:hypothetical protein